MSNRRIKRKPPNSVKIGGQIIDLVTSGMYNNCLMVLREYIQNAVDSIDEARGKQMLKEKEGRVDITIDGQHRKIEIVDNGVGLSNKKAEEVLCGLGISTKSQGEMRGFRGVGRLGGLGYCEEVRFETRSSKQERVAVVTWDARKFKGMLAKKSGERNLKSSVRAATNISFRRATQKDCSHFFRATMFGVHGFHKDSLMNTNTVKTYISHAAPVSFEQKHFRFAKKIINHVAKTQGYRSYDIRLNGYRILRPHLDTIAISSTVMDEIRQVELFTIRGRNGNITGRGWYAKLNHLASIPPKISMRGIRVLQGNMEIGDERFLADYYSERRFSVWHVGEIHLDFSIKANARRDGFEQSPDCEAFLEQVSLLGRHLSYLCRASSKNRGALLRAERELSWAEGLLNQPFLLDESHAVKVRSRVTNMLDAIESRNGNGKCPTMSNGRLTRARRKLKKFCNGTPQLYDILDGRSLRQVDKKELLGEIGKAIIESSETAGTAEELLATIMSPYLKRPKHSLRKPSSSLKR